MVSEQLLKRFYPDQARNGTLAFYSWVRQHIEPKTVLLNLGAGPTTGNLLRTFRGEVARVVGADIDPIVLQNSELDETYIIKDNVLPFSNAAFDVVLSDYVLEHVEYPLQFLSEVHRVLKPGGVFFFRTPNKYHYVSLIARSTSHWFHALVANRVRGLSEEAHEPWPTFHRLNSRDEIIRLAKESGFDLVELRLFEGAPSYLMFNVLPFLVGIAYERLVNRFEGFSGLRANIFGKLIK